MASFEPAREFRKEANTASLRQLSASVLEGSFLPSSDCFDSSVNEPAKESETDCAPCHHEPVVQNKTNQAQKT